MTLAASPLSPPSARLLVEFLICRRIRALVALAAMSLFASPALADNRAQIKADEAKFVRTVDESISGDRIAAMPFRFVGKHVDLHCTVWDTTSRSFFDAKCATIRLAIHAPNYSRGIKSGQAIRVLGIVEEPVVAGMDEQVYSEVRALLVEWAGHR
jgi:hypothetical protein